MSDISLTHQFVSALANGSDTSQVQPSNWNEAHKLTAPSSLNDGETGIVTGLNTTGVLTLNAVKSSAALQYLRRNTSNSAFEFGSLPVASVGFLISSDYNFTKQAPTENLSPSLKTFTLNTVPLGVNGTNIAHYLGIYNNSDVLQETILISGGSAVSGSASGTIIATTIVGTYAAGSYKIGSVTGGLSEAFYVVSTHGIILVDSAISIAATVTIPNGKNITVLGKGSGINQISRSSHFTAGDLFLNNVNACLTLEGVGIEQGLFTQSGSAVHGSYSPSGFVCLKDVQISNGQYGVIVESCQFVGNFIRINNQAPAGYKPVAGIYLKSANSGFEATSNINLMDVTINAYPRQDANELTYGVLSDGSDGVNIFNLQVCADTCIKLNPTASYVTNWHIEGLESDGPTHVGVITTGTGLISGICINGGYINGPTSTSGGASASTNIAFSLGGNLENFKLSNFRIDNAIYGGIAVGSIHAAPVLIEISNVSITNGNTANNAAQVAIVLVDGSKAVSVRNLRVANTASVGKMKNAIQIGNASDCVVDGVSANLVNDGTSGAAVLYNPAGTFSNLLVRNILDCAAILANAIVAAATLSLGTSLAEYYVISGTTGVGTFQGLWEGRRFTLITISGAVTFTAGATIGNTFTSTINKPINCIVTSGKVYLS